MKKAPKEELLTAIREITRGNIYVSHDVAMRAFKKSLEIKVLEKAKGMEGGQ